MERVSAAQNSRQRLERGPHHIVVRLLRGQRHARRLTVEAQLPRPLAPGVKAIAYRVRPDLARRAVLGDLLEEVAVRVEEERDPRHEVVDVEPRVDAPLHVLEAVAQRERELLQRRRACFAYVIAAHRNRVPLRHLLRAEREDVGDDPHRRTRRKDVLLLRDEFLQDVVLDRARQLLPVGALLLGDDQVHREDHRGRRIDRHRRGDVAERDTVEERLHVGERRHVHAALPHLAERELVVRVAAHQRGQIEGDAQTGSAGAQQRLVAFIRLFGRAEAGELPHRPELSAITGRMDPARVRKGAGIGQIARIVEIGDVGGAVDALDPTSRYGRERVGALAKQFRNRFGNRFHINCIIADVFFSPSVRLPINRSR